MNDEEFNLRLIASYRLENRRLKLIAKRLHQLLDAWRKSPPNPNVRYWIAWLETVLGEMEQ